jgi:hypothetical protein
MIFMLLAVIGGMFSRSLDWRGYVLMAWAGSVVLAIYTVNTGSWS